MTVQELIEKLQKFPQDTQVCYEMSEFPGDTSWWDFDLEYVDFENPPEAKVPNLLFIQKTTLVSG